MPPSFLVGSSIWAIASAIALMTLGAMCLTGGRARPRGSLAFGLFAIAWGAQIGAGNLASILPTRAGIAFFLAFAAFSFAATYFLVEFGASQVPRPGLPWTIARIAAAGAGLLGALVLVLDPSLIALPTSGGITHGPLFIPLLSVPQFAGFAIALIGLFQARRASPTHRTALRSGILFAGLGVYVAFIAGYEASLYALALLVYPGPEDLPFVLLFLGLTIVTLLLAGLILLEARRAPRREDRRALRWLGAALLVPLAWGLVEGALALTMLVQLTTVGLWRIVGVTIVAYGLARWRLFDLPQRTARAAASAGGAAAAVAGGAAVYGAGTLVSPEPVLPVLAGFVVLGVTIRPGMRFARRVLLREPRVEAPAPPAPTLYGQRLDSYRAALEASLVRDTLEEDEAFLSALRKRFVIDESEHRVLLHYARSSCIVAKDGEADVAYERLRLLGEGGAGRTWLARDRLRERLVVLKEPLEHWQKDPRLHESVLREARLAARVHHPNVLAVEEVVEHKGMPVLVLEYAEGGSLADALRTRGALPWREAIALQLKILRGVEAIHAAGIIHRDLKPSNVLLASDGTPKVADFGIAIPTSTDKTIVEGGTTFAGTLAYVAPEVIAGGPCDRRSDVYACAAILHQCIYGSPPGVHVPEARDVPAELRAILMDALSPVPARRPPTARALAEELTSRVSP